MELRFNRERKSGICIVTIFLVLTKTEQEKIDKFGQPEVNVGGQFVEFTLPSKMVKIPHGFPFSQRFDGIELGHDEAKRRGDSFVEEMKTRIKISFDNFKAIQDNFNDGEVSTI